MAKADRNVITLYFKKSNEFRAIVLELIALYFNTYGVYQSKGEMILTALGYTRDALKNKEKIQESESILTSIYARVGK